MWACTIQPYFNSMQCKKQQLYYFKAIWQNCEGFKSKSKKKKIDKKSKTKDQSKNVDKIKQKDDKKVKANSQSKKTASAQVSQQQNNQQVSKNNQQQVASQAQSQNQGNAKQGQQPQQKTQGQINRERGYDPNGAPLLPGQDHAAGSNPDGSPDAWVQGQINWAKRNGLMNPDGTPTQKEKDLEASQDQYSEGDDGGQFGGYVPNP